MDRRARTRLAGILAALSALAATEVVNLLDATGPSLLIAVEAWFVDTFGGSLKDLAVELFGGRHKTALAIGAVIVTVLLGMVAAGWELRRRWSGVAVIGAFGVLGIAATARHAQGSVTVAVLAAVVGAAVGSVVLLVLLEHFGLRLAPWSHRHAGSSRADGATGDEVAADDGSRSVGLVTATRRDVVVWGLGTGAAAATAALLAKGVGDGIRQARSPIPDALPAPARTETVPAAQPFSTNGGLSPYITPTESFYRIDTSISTPYVPTDDWALEVTGMVDRPLHLTYDELLARDLVEEVVTLSCVSNEVGGSLVGNARWTGVPLRVLLAEAGVDRAATQLVGESVDGFTAGFPTAALDDPERSALVAVGMNGRPLPRDHGFPARLVVAGLYGYVSATKWLREIRLTTLEDEDGYWIPRGWAKEAPVKTQSRIDVPRNRDVLVAGPVSIAGVAWAPTRGISRVEVRVDTEDTRGDWQEASLGHVVSDDTWVQWHLEWAAEPGDHTIVVRATDGDGMTQGEEEVSPIPDGAEGWHHRRAVVAGR